MDSYLTDSPIGEGGYDYGDNREYIETGRARQDERYNSNIKQEPVFDSNVQDKKYNSKIKQEPVFDFNVQDVSRDNNFQGSTDPYYEPFDFLGSPNNQNLSPIAIVDLNGAQEFNRGDPASIEPFGFGVSGRDQLNALDLLISPSNQDDGNFFTSSQYFSPNTRSNQFSELNPIVEVTYNGYQDNTFSPNDNQGGIKIPGTLNVGLYLSPTAFLSPLFTTYENSHDTIASPYSNSYLNSPPPMNFNQNSIPNPNAFGSTTISQALSPPNPSIVQQGFISSPSAPMTPLNRKLAEPVATATTLTQEEKAKRRREFHNAVERRRRDLIKEKIKVLGILVPPSLLTPQLCATQVLLKLSQPLSPELQEIIEVTKVKEMKPNKALILLTSVDYVRHLQYVLEKQKARREEIESIISSFEEEPGSYNFVEDDNYTTPNTSLHSQAIPEFNPDEFFSDVITDSIK